VVQSGSTDEVFSRPSSVEVARFLGVETLIEGRVIGNENGVAHVDCGAMRIDVAGDGAAGEPVWIAVRPEEIDVQDEEDPAGGEVRNVLVGRVTNAVRAETHYRVEIDCGVRVVAAVSRARFRESRIVPGRGVRVSFEARSAYLIRPKRGQV
jgi:tungstate transport system ATP-binding protein